MCFFVILLSQKKYEKYYLEFPLGDNSLPVGVVITYTLFSIHCRHFFEFWAGFALAVGQPKNFKIVATQ